MASPAIPQPARAQSTDVWLYAGLGAAVLVVGVLLYLKEKGAGSLLNSLSSNLESGGTKLTTSQLAAGSSTNANATTTDVSEGVTAAETVASDAASGNAAGAATAGIQAIITQLTQHSARLKGATAENTAADEVVPAFDADIQATNAAYLAGEITIAQAESALVAILANCFNSLQALVGKPGTAWSGSASSASAGQVPCNKACTVSCCIYWNDLFCAIYGCAQFGSGKGGALSALQGQSTASSAIGGGWLAGGSYFSYVPEVYPPDDSAYGNFSRAAYILDWAPPATTPTTALQHIL